MARRAVFSGAAREFFICAAAYLAYRVTRGATDSAMAGAAAFEHSDEIVRFEKAHGVFIEPAIQRGAYRAGVLDAAGLIYLHLQTSVLAVFLCLLYRRHRAIYFRTRNQLGLVLAVGLACFLLFPTAPPRLSPELGLSDPMRSISGISVSWQSLTPIANPYAAMPSLHVACALVLTGGLVSSLNSSMLRLFALSYPALVALVVVATANHFVLDVVAGAVTACLAVTVSWTWARRFA